MNQRDKIKYIIEQYRKKDYTTLTFCNMFIDILYYQKDGSLSNEDFILLDKYGSIFSRYSDNDEGVGLGFLFDEKKILSEFYNLIIEFE